MSNTFLRAQDAAKYLAISKSTFWRWIKEGKLPQGIHLSPRVTVWRKADLDAFIESMIDPIKGVTALSKVEDDIQPIDENIVTAVTDAFVQLPNQKPENTVLA